MTGLTANPIFIGAIAALLSALLTMAVRMFARAYGYVAKPKSDRWHKRPTAMLGGVAIFLATVVVFLAFVTPTRESLAVVGEAPFFFLSDSSTTSSILDRIRSSLVSWSARAFSYSPV